MKMLFVFLALGLVVTVTFLTTLQNGAFRKYLDTHPSRTFAPAVEYYLGEGYYIVGNLEESATYYQRVAQRYPKSPYAEDAYFNYLQALDDMNLPRMQMVEKY